MIIRKTKYVGKNNPGLCQSNSRLVDHFIDILNIYTACPKNLYGKAKMGILNKTHIALHNVGRADQILNLQYIYRECFNIVYI